MLTDYEKEHLRLIRAVLIKWTTGKHKGRYTHEQREDDLKRIAEIDLILN